MEAGLMNVFIVT